MLCTHWDPSVFTSFIGRNMWPAYYLV